MAETTDKIMTPDNFINQSIIWHYNPLWVFAFSVRVLQVLLSLAVAFQFLTFSSLDLP
jgi:hypothetical protein